MLSRMCLHSHWRFFRPFSNAQSMLPFARCRYKCGSGAPVACSCYSHYSVSSTSGKESALPREKGKSCPALHLERYMYRAHRSRLALFVDPPQLSSNSNSLSRIKAHQ